MPRREPDLAQTMEYLGFNQVQMSQLIGVSEGAISRWLKKNRSIPETVRRLLVLLDNGRNKVGLQALERYDPFTTAAREIIGKRGRGRPPRPY